MRWSESGRALIFIVLAALIIQAAQAENEPVEFENETVEIQEIIDNETAFDGKYVVIEGKIINECSAGCWFIVDDGTGQLYVDILPNNFVIPQRTGSDAKVYGKIAAIDSDPLMIGEIVKIGGDIFR